MLRIPLAIAACAVALAAAPPAAQAARSAVPVSVGKPGDVLVLRGHVSLLPGQSARTIGIVDGDVDIARGATVTGDVLAVDGTVRVAGVVRGHVVTVGGRALVASSGVVRKGIVYGSDAPVLAPGARVSGSVKRIDVHVGRLAPFISGVLWWIAVSISSLVLGLLLLLVAPRAADATFERMRSGWGPAIGIGCAAFLGLPVIGVLALATIVGIPFGIGLLLALLPLGALGYVTSAWLLGRRLHADGRLVAFIVGWGILRGLALLPLLGLIVFLAAMVFGLGALTWTLLQTGRDTRDARAASAAGGPESPTAPAI
ncbi:MAG TPA: polymer-forming cytoskeletal protein [Solirubrobacteraceae bacterium]|nr:polymer-forming cytoskeletal protein [Solirubrobacteraceae bacterium]